MYDVAICTHNRADIVSQTILPYLAAGNVPRERVHLFVTPGQEDTYRSLVPQELYGHIHTGGTGLANNRNAVVQHFPADTPVVQFDDDVRALLQLTPSGKLAEVTDPDSLICQAFDIISRTRATIWGVYPVANAFYMRRKTSAGLLFLIGQCMGFLNRPDELVSVNDKDDYERSLLRYETDGLVVRLDSVSCKAGGVRRNKGGLQHDQRIENNNDAVRYLLKRWPALVKPKKPRPDGYMEIRLINLH